MLHNTETTVP